MNYKLAISGIGAVGGYYGGFLARQYSPGSEVDVCFIARGENERVIREKGLRLETTRGAFTAVPAKVSSDAAEIGVVDLLICCTKGYDLEENLRQLRPCIGKETVILPLQNGVDSRERILALYPENEVWDGCVYLVARLTEPGLVTETGGLDPLFFGSAKDSEKKLAAAEKLFTAAGIRATPAADIRQTTWEKFLFISTIATLTSYMDQCIGEVLAHAENKSMLVALLTELKAVADAKGILLPENSIQKTLEKMAKLPYETTSSMHSDFKKGGKTELESLTGYVVRTAQALNVPAPAYARMYAELLKRPATR